jgi:small nuclear ribonucleoprotein (snRNP)-like protein
MDCIDGGMNIVLTKVKQILVRRICMLYFRLVYRVDPVEGVMNIVLTKVEQILDR